MKNSNRKRTLLGILGLLIFVSLACGELNINIETQEPGSTTNNVETPVVDEPVGETPDVPTGLAWLSSAAHADVQLPEMLGGLLYRINDTLYLVDGSGTPVVVANGLYDATLSPDLTRLAYASQEEDLFLMDMNSGEISRLSDTPLLLERGASWWPGRPDVLVYNMTPAEDLGPWAGYLGAYDLQAGELLTLDTVSSSYNGFVLSPDGRAILYDDAGEPVIYTWGAGVTKLSLSNHGLMYTSYYSPAWSPDGSRVAFLAVGYDENSTSGASQAAVVIYRMVDGQVEVRHEYELYGMRGAPQLAWSPDGKYLAVTTPGDANSPDGPIALWVLSMDGGEERYLGYATDPIWQPDGQHLAFILWPDFGTEQGSYQQDAHVTLVEPGVWEPQEVPELLGASLMEWHALP